MNCFFHPTEPAVAQCVDCQKGLCVQCASKYQPSLCPTCATDRSKSNTTGEITKIVIKSIVCFLIGALITWLITKELFELTLAPFLLFSVLFAGIPWGWSFLNRIIPLDASGNISFVLIFYTIKLIVAYFIGFIIMTFNVLKILFLLVKRLLDKKMIRRAENMSELDNQ